jgi:hypothetical protein
MRLVKLASMAGAAWAAVVKLRAKRAVAVRERNMVISFNNSSKGVSPCHRHNCKIPRCNMMLAQQIRTVKHFYCTATWQYGAF